MYSILKTTLNGKHDHFPSDTTAASLEPGPSDPWLFTDPFALDLYMQRGLIGQLEEDIRTYAMCDGCWTPEELEYKLEIRRLLRECLIAPIGSFGSLSPHPTVYRTLKVGNLTVSRQRYNFNAAEELIFAPWLARYCEPGLKGPLQVGQLDHVSIPCLCCESFPDICIHCDNTLAVMRQILKYRNSGK